MTSVCTRHDSGVNHQTFLSISFIRSLCGRWEGVLFSDTTGICKHVLGQNRMLDSCVELQLCVCAVIKALLQHCEADLKKWNMTLWLQQTGRTEKRFLKWFELSFWLLLDEASFHDKGKDPSKVCNWSSNVFRSWQSYLSFRCCGGSAWCRRVNCCLCRRRLTLKLQTHGDDDLMLSLDLVCSLKKPKVEVHGHRGGEDAVGWCESGRGRRLS